MKGQIQVCGTISVGGRLSPEEEREINVLSIARDLLPHFERDGREIATFEPRMPALDDLLPLIDGLLGELRDAPEGDWAWSQGILAAREARGIEFSYCRPVGTIPCPHR